MRARCSFWPCGLAQRVAVLFTILVLSGGQAYAESAADESTADESTAVGARADENARFPARKWSTKSALTIEKGRLELGAFSSAAYGLTERVELGAHPVGLFVFPALGAKVNWWSAHSRGLCPCRVSERAWWFSSRHRLFSPSPLLHLLAKEGSGGFLPDNTEIPFSLGMMNEAVLTRDLFGHLLSLRAGVTVTAGRSEDLPMVEFPFFYSTLASLYSPFVVHMGLAVEGTIYGPLDYEFVPRLVMFRPDEDIPWPGEHTPMAYSQETKIQLHLRLFERHRLSAGAALVIARYPIGVRSFLVPTLDYRAALF